MVTKRFNARCKACSRIYSIESSNEDHCFQCADNLKVQARSIANRQCIKCNEKFYSPNSVKICPICSVKKYNDFQRDPKVYDNTKTIKRSPGRKVSLEELIRRQEYKRVMDDAGWDHYLRGRKWDRI